MNILLTSAGRRSYIIDYFKNCNGVGKIFASNSEYSIALKKSDGYFISPLIYSEEYIPSIIEFCKKNEIKAVISLFDIDLLILAQNEQKFRENGIELILAPASFIEVCNDKYKTFLFLKEIGILTPKTYKNIPELKEALTKGDIRYPIIMKPRWGMASIGIYKVFNNDELETFTKKCLREIFDSYLKYESNKTPEEAIIYQEIIEGEEYGLDILNTLEGEYVKTFAKQKLTMRSGETDLGKTVLSDKFEGIAQKISLYSGHHGILSVDCFKNDHGVYVIEMNCRISGHYPLSYLAGFNYPQIIIDWLRGRKNIQKENLTFIPDLYIVKELVPTVLIDTKHNDNEN